MLIVDHYVAPSAIHGLGVFTRSRIQKGETVYRFHPAIDREISGSELEHLPEHVRRRVEAHSEWYPDRSTFRLSADGCYYMNHSSCPNLIDAGDTMYAARDIEADEELTCDYAVVKVYSFHPTVEVSA